jgi:hypothetical protein
LISEMKKNGGEEKDTKACPETSIEGTHEKDTVRRRLTRCQNKPL